MNPTPLKLGLAALALLCSAQAASSEKVGVAAAVKPDAFSGQGGNATAPLKIGKSVFYNERISTGETGLVQVLLVDGSTFTVGPNSNLVIDKFVYNPSKKTGELVATFSKGAMRFVGGNLSKNDGGVRVKTPAGALAIRGGIAQAAFGRGRGLVSFIYGDYAQLTLANGRGVLRAYEAGNTIDTGLGRVRPTTQQDIRFFAQALSSGKVQQATIKTPAPKQAPKFGSGNEAAIKNESEYTRLLGGLTPVTPPGKRPNTITSTTFSPSFGGASPRGRAPGAGGPTPPPVVGPPSGVGRCGGFPNCGRFGNTTDPEGRALGRRNRP